MAELADAVIVGGGILGAALVYELARRNQRVVLLDAHASASGATGSGFAWINATSKREDEAYHRLNALAMARYDALAVEWGEEQIGLHEGGSLFWVRGDDAAGRARLLAMASRLQSWNYPVATLNAEEIAALEPQTRRESAAMEGAVGLFAPMDRWLDAPRCTRMLLEVARRRGAEIHEYTPATEFTLGISRNITQVRTREANIATPTLILAAGVQTTALAVHVVGRSAETFVPMRRVPGILVETPPDSAPGFVQRVLYPSDAGGMHLRPTPGGGLLLGADDLDSALVHDYSDALLAKASGQLLARTASVFADFPLEALQQSASARICMRPFPDDERPILGALPEVRGVFVAVTHSGVTLAPLLAQLLVDQILSGRVPPQLTPYRPHRFLTP